MASAVHACNDWELEASTLPVEQAAITHAPARAHGLAHTDADARLRVLFETNYDLIWRFIRRLGVAKEAVDDAAQDVFVVVAQRLGDIRPGCERSFLFSTALRVAAQARRSSRRGSLSTEVESVQLTDPQCGPDERVDYERARALCDRVLDTMPLELRSVFVLSQSEEMTMAEISSCLGIPPGTVASRLRRAREIFEQAIAELEQPGGAR